MVEGQQIGWHEGGTRYEPPVKIVVKGNEVLVPAELPIHVSLAMSKWQEGGELKLKDLTFEQIAWVMKNIVITPVITEDFLNSSNQVIIMEVLDAILTRIAPTKEETENLGNSPTSS